MRAHLKKVILPFILFGIFFVTYIHNMSRAVYGGDVGDLVTAAALHGVAHPPGYPLFTFLGFLLTKIFFFLPPAAGVGLISVVSGSFGIVLFYLLTKKLTNNSLVSFIASSILGTSYLYWFYSEIAEVFALNAFFAICLFYLALTIRSSKKNIWKILFFFVLGLSFTNHQTIIFIVPSLFLLIAQSLFLTIRKNPLMAVWSIGGFLLGLTPFAYVFIASSTHPLINWDNVHDISSFIHLILRQDYGTLKAGVFDSPTWMQRVVTLRLYAQYFFLQLTIPVVVISSLGLVSFFQKQKLLMTGILLAFLLAGPTFVVYAGFPLTGQFIIGAYERFVLLSFVVFLIPFGNGLMVFGKFLSSLLPKRHYEIFFEALFLFVPLMLFIYNFPKTNLSSVALAQTYAEDYLTVLPKNAVLLISGDTEIFNTWYVHYVLRERPDILLYNIGATPVTANIIGQALQNVPTKNRSDQMIRFVQNLEHTRPIFSTTRFPSKTNDTIIWMPYGLSFQMYQSKDVLPTADEYLTLTKKIWSELNTPTKKDLENPALHSLTITDIPTNYSNSLLAVGTFFYSQYHDTDKALAYYQKALTVSVDNEKAYTALGILYTTLPNSCEKTIENMSASISLNPLQELPYFVLYTTYKTCLKDIKKADKIKQDFEIVFQKNFDKEAENNVTAAVESLKKQ